MASHFNNDNTSAHCQSCLENPCVCHDETARCPDCGLASSRYRDQSVCRHCEEKKLEEIANEKFIIKHTGESRPLDQRVREGYNSNFPRGNRITVVADEDAQRLDYNQTNCAAAEGRPAANVAPCRPGSVRDCVTPQVHTVVYDRQGNAIEEEVSQQVRYECDPVRKKFKAVHLQGPKR